MNDAFDAYDSAKAEVEQVNTQLAETQTRIDQLRTKGSLTFVEQDELANLKETNRYLEMELDLKQKIANEKAVEAANSASTDYKKNYADSHSVEDRIKEFEDTYGENSFSNLQYGNHLDAETFFLGDSASEELFVLKAYEQMYSNALKDGNKEGADLADLQSRIEDQKSALNEKALGLIDIIQKIQDVPEELRTDANKEDLQSAKNQLYDIYQYTDNAKWKQLKLDDIYSDQDLADARKSLLDLASSMKTVGITVEDVEKKFPGLAKAAQDAGLSVEDIVSDINSSAGVFGPEKYKQQIAKSANADLVRNAKSNGFFDWINSLSTDDLEIVYDLSFNADSANWNLEQWQSNFESAKRNVLIGSIPNSV